MFTLDDKRKLVQARPFVPFRLHISGGNSVEVRSPEVVMLGKRFAVVGILDPKAKESLLDRWTTVYYMHVTQAEQLDPGAPPFTPPQNSGPSNSPAPT